MFQFKISFISTESHDKMLFFDMIRANLELSNINNNSYSDTIGVDISVKHLHDCNEQIAKLIIWDISPTNFFQWVRPLFFNGSIGSIVLHSNNTAEGTTHTMKIIREFRKHTFLKFLVILLDPMDTDTHNQKLAEEAEALGFLVRYFDVDESYFSKKDLSEKNYMHYYQNMRKFYESIILDIFVDAVGKIPKNAYNIEEFREVYFESLEEYDSSLEKMYKILEVTGFKHNYRNIYVEIPEGRFSVNIFTGACYHIYPNGHTKYLCLEPAAKNFSGWSNILFLPNTFMLSIAKAFYLIEHNFDSVVLDQLEEIKKKLF
jgi:GTPase SAR1 family protein